MIKIIVPSINPINLSCCLEHINRNTEGDYNVAVIGDWYICNLAKKFNRVITIEEKKRGGCINALMEGVRQYPSEYVILLGDDMLPEKGWLNNLYSYMKKKNLDYAGYRIKNILGKELKQYKYIYETSGIPLTMSGLIKPEYLISTGCFDRGYKHYWFDADICMRIWKMGGKIGICPDSWICLTSVTENVGENYHQDEALFRKYWLRDLRRLKYRNIWYWLKLGFVKELIRKRYCRRKSKKGNENL